MCRGSESSGVKFIAVTLWSLDFLGGCQREGRGWGQGQAWRLTSEQAAPQVVTGVEGTAGEQGFLRTGCQAQSSMPVSSPSSQEGGDIITVPVNRWGRRHRTMNSQAQGHRAGTCQRWGLSLGISPSRLTLAFGGANRCQSWTHPYLRGRVTPHGLVLLQV